MNNESFEPDLRNSQLFLDDSLLDDSIRVQRIWHQPEKYPQPVMRGEFPWEGDCPCLYGTVLRVDGLFRMWYVGTRNSSKPRVCYAESHDGLTWEKPQLGICEYDGNKKNNIVIQPEYPNGFLDDCSMIYEPDDEWPYKLLYWDSMDASPLNWGIFATRSKDGIHFESIGKVLPKWGDRFIAATEKVDGKYRIYGRGTFETGLDEFGNWKEGIRHVTEYALDPFPRKRPVVYTESEDLHNWTAGSRSSSPIPPIRFRCSSTRCHHSGTREYGWPICCACTPPPTCWIRSWSGATTAGTGTAATSANPSFRLAPRARSTRCGSTWRPTRHPQLQPALVLLLGTSRGPWRTVSRRVRGHRPGDASGRRVLLALFRPHRGKRIRRRTHQADFVGRRRSPSERRSAARHHRTSHQRHHCRRQGVRRDTGRCEPADRGLPVRRLQSDRRKHTQLRGVPRIGRFPAGTSWRSAR